jgi:hypothetical protein
MSDERPCRFCGSMREEAQRMQITYERIDGEDITLRVPSPEIIRSALRRGEAA